MPCHSITQKNIPTVTPDQTVEDVIAFMQKKKLQYAPVVDKDKKLAGMFSFEILYKNILPVSVVMSDGVQLDMTIQAAPGIAKRLRKVTPLPVREVMEQKLHVLHPETPTWEGVNYLVQHGGPVCVVEQDSHVFIGVVTGLSAMEELQRLQETDA